MTCYTQVHFQRFFGANMNLHINQRSVCTTLIFCTYLRKVVKPQNLGSNAAATHIYNISKGVQPKLLLCTQKVPFYMQDVRAFVTRNVMCNV